MTGNHMQELAELLFTRYSLFICSRFSSSLYNRIFSSSDELCSSSHEKILRMLRKAFVLRLNFPERSREAAEFEKLYRKKETLVFLCYSQLNHFLDYAAELLRKNLVHELSVFVIVFAEKFCLHAPVAYALNDKKSLLKSFQKFSKSLLLFYVNILQPEKQQIP